MASDPSKSTTSSKYDVNSQIAALLEKYFTSPTSSTRPSAVFTSGPNKGLPVSALPPSVTPFSQRGNVRRTSKVTEETNRARRQREARTQNPDRKPNQTPSQNPNRTPDQVDERRRRNENERIIRDQQARARGEARVERGEAGPLSYSTEKRFGEGTPTYPYYSSTPRALFDPVEAEKASRKFQETEEFRTVNAPQRNPAPSRNLGPSALSQALSRVEAQPPVIFSATPGPAPYDYQVALERINLANIDRISDIEQMARDRIAELRGERGKASMGNVARAVAPSSYLDPYRDVVLEQSARYKPFVPKEPPAPAEPSEEMLKAAMNPSGRFTPTPYPIDPGLARSQDELALRGMKAEDREKVEAQARSLQNQGLLYSAPMGLARFYVDPVVDVLGSLGADISEVAGGLSRYGADAVAGTPDFIDRNFGDFIIDPRKNRFAQPAGLRPVRSPTMRSAPRNPLDPLSRLIEPMAEGASDPRSMYYFPGKFY